MSYVNYKRAICMFIVFCMSLRKISSQKEGQSGDKMSGKENAVNKATRRMKLGVLKHQQTITVGVNVSKRIKRTSETHRNFILELMTPKLYYVLSVLAYKYRLCLQNEGTKFHQRASFFIIHSHHLFQVRAQNREREFPPPLSLSVKGENQS